MVTFERKKIKTITLKNRITINVESNDFVMTEVEFCKFMGKAEQLKNH